MLQTKGAANVSSFVCGAKASRSADRALFDPLIGDEYSLLAHKNSLLDRVGNLICKARKMQEKFCLKIVPEGRFAKIPC